MSPGNDNQKYSVLCGEQIVLPVIGSKKTYVFCSLDSLCFYLFVSKGTFVQFLSRTSRSLCL